MRLLDQHKADRRQRILAAARDLVARHGYDGLTMRGLARVARVSVPTLYNLVGGKDTILAALLAAQVQRVAEVHVDAEASFFGRARAAFERGMAAVADAPDFYRELIRMFLTSPDARGLRRRTEDAYLALMTANLSAAKHEGQLAPWAEPRVVAGHMFAQYIAAFLAWAAGELDLDQFRTVALSGICHLLLGVTRGRFAEEVEAQVRALTPLVPTKAAPEPHHAPANRPTHR